MDAVSEGVRFRATMMCGLSSDGNDARRLSEHMANHAARDILDIDHPLAEIRVINRAQRAAILLGDLVERVLHVVAFVFQVPEDLVDQRAIFNDEKMRVKNPRILRADGVRNALLDLQKLGASRDQSRFEAGNLFGQLFGGNCPKRDLFVVQPMHDDPSVGDTWRDGNPLKTGFLFDLRITSTHACKA